MLLNVSVAIQHHPRRATLIGPLADALGGAPEVVEDPDPDGFPSPMRTYHLALSRTPDAATHRLIVQDDAWPAERFLQRLMGVVEEKPDDMIALFVPGSGVHRRKMIHAVGAGLPWARLSTTWVPTVALLWPISRVREFLSWWETSRYDFRKNRGDDGIVGRFTTRHRIDVYAPVPSLIQHPDVEPSLIGRRAMAGRNRARVAAVFSPE